jgi:hypothetical protein
MLSGDIYTSFPENLRDPMNADPAAVGFQDLFLAFSQSLDLGGFAIAPAFRAPSHLDQISGSGLEEVWVRVSQCRSPGMFFELKIKVTAN